MAAAIEPAVKKIKLENEVFSSFHDRFGEVQTLKNAIEGLFNYPPGQLLQNLTLLNCNAADNDPKSFNDASCSVQDHPKRFPFGVLFDKGLKILHDFLVEKRKPESENLKAILACLLIYLMDTDSQEKLNENDLSTCPEPILTAILVNHFLLRLTPVTTCTLDKSKVQAILQDDSHPKHKKQHFSVRYQYDEPHEILTCCPCDVNGKCQLTKQIMLADTSFGNKSVWHGKLDCLFGGVAVGSHKKKKDSPGMKSCFEFDSIDAPCDQIVAQAITFSFLRAKEETDVTFVPTVGVSADKIAIYFYDSKDDILLKSVTSLFSETGRPCLEVILMVWLAINYQHLGCKLGEDLKKQAKHSNFVEIVGDMYKINIFRNELTYGIKYKEQWKPIPQERIELVKLPERYNIYKRH